jgi:O-antigen/teichoic acid export membrane protein
MMIKFLGMFSGYIFIFIALRISDIQNYGAFSLSLAFVNIASILGRMGFDLSIVKNISVNSVLSSGSSNCREIYFKGLHIVLAGGLLITILSYGFAPHIALYLFKKSTLEPSLQTASLAILPQVLLFYNAGALRGLKKVAKYSLLINLNFLVAIVFMIFILLIPVKNELETAYVLASYLICIVSFVWWFRESKILRSQSIYTTSYSKLIVLSFPMLSASAITILNGWSDTLILGILSSDENVGIFQVLLKLAAIINIVLFAVNSISAPQFARLSEPENKLQLQRYVQKSTKLIVLIVTPLSILLLLGYSELVKILGASIDTGFYFSSFGLLCLGQVFNAFCGSGGQLLSMTGYEKTNRNIIFISFLISVAVNIVMIPSYGVLGAALANMIGLIFRNLLYVVIISKRLEVNTLYNPISDMKKIIRKTQSLLIV